MIEDRPKLSDNPLSRAYTAQKTCFFARIPRDSILVTGSLWYPKVRHIEAAVDVNLRHSEGLAAAVAFVAYQGQKVYFGTKRRESTVPQEPRPDRREVKVPESSENFPRPI